LLVVTIALHEYLIVLHHDVGMLLLSSQGANFRDETVGGSLDIFRFHISFMEMKLKGIASLTLLHNMS
jgi:hypothetical protein